MFEIITNNLMTYGAFSEMNSSNLVSGISLKNANDSLNMAIHTGDDVDQVMKNRKDFFNLFQIDYRTLVTTRQTHSNIFYIAQNSSQSNGDVTDFLTLPEADAIITTKLFLPIALFTADCMPLFVYIKNIPLIALIHSGWKGAHSRIIYKTLRYIMNYYNISGKDIVVAPGPTILNCCYSVSEDFFKKFNKKYLLFKNKTLYFNLYEANLDQVRELGIPEKNIVQNPFCTFCHTNDCHSYRKDKTNFRMTSFMMLRTV